MADAPVTGNEHWTPKTAEGDVRLFLWEKYAGSPEGKPAVLFVHGSSMASQPTFDLTVPGRPDSSVMDWFAERGFVCWCVDMEGYGRSDKTRDINCDIANGADDLAAATDYIARTRGVRQFLTYGISSGALRAALFAQRHPERVARLALDAFVWTGEGAPTLEQRRKKLPEFLAQKRRPDRPRVRRTRSSSATTPIAPRSASSTRSPTPSSRSTIRCPTAPTSTCARSCRSSIRTKITVPTIVLRGQFDGIAGFDDLVEFFKRLPNPDKQFSGACPASRTRASSRRTTGWSTTSCTRTSRSPRPPTSVRRTGRLPAGEVAERRATRPRNADARAGPPEQTSAREMHAGAGVSA